MKKKLIGIVSFIVIVVGVITFNNINKTTDDVKLSSRLMAYSTVTAKNNIGKISGDISEIDVMTNTRNNLIFLKNSLKYCSDEYKPKLEELILSNESVIKEEANSAERFTNAMNDVDIILKEIAAKHDLINNEKNKEDQYKEVDKYVLEIME